jgi:hypothetical protein
VVAVPRISFVTQPTWPVPIYTSANDQAPEIAGCRIIGAAYNFARKEGHVVIPLGTVLNVGIGRMTQGVWFERTCGWFGTYLYVEQWDPEAERWVPIGRDGAYLQESGPFVGRVRNVRVPVKIDEPGDYRLRARVWTIAMPSCPDVDYATARRCGDIAFDQVPLKVRVVERITPEELEKEYIPEPADQAVVGSAYN